jgi:3-methyladenine DNA glycosylase/8-oxoguanine DNA glycosylase
MTTWKLPSTPPHDFFLCLDINEYFDHEHDPEQVFEEGFHRPVKAGDQFVVVTIFFNGDPDQPEFSVTTDADLSEEEIDDANQSIRRMLGIEIDLKPLYKQVENDPVLGSLTDEFYGFKRLSHASVFDDAVNRIIQTQISHKPTAKKMVYAVREAYGNMIPWQNGYLAAWPQPIDLIGADPVSMREHGLSKRKGEYIIGLANEFVSGNLSNEHLEKIPAENFYEELTNVRGLGPTTVQDLMFLRTRPDAVFPSNKSKGKEKGLRRWITLSYGEDPDTITEEHFQELITNWKGQEALAVEYLFLNYVMRMKERQAK